MDKFTANATPHVCCAGAYQDITVRLADGAVLSPSSSCVHVRSKEAAPPQQFKLFALIMTAPRQSAGSCTPHTFASVEHCGAGVFDLTSHGWSCLNIVCFVVHQGGSPMMSEVPPTTSVAVDVAQGDSDSRPADAAAATVAVVADAPSTDISTVAAEAIKRSTASAAAGASDDDDDDDAPREGDASPESVELGFVEPVVSAGQPSSSATPGSGAGAGVGAGAGADAGAGGGIEDDVDEDVCPLDSETLLHRTLDWSSWDGGKAGGKPIWLDPKHVPTRERLLCDQCGRQMVFMLQVYAPLDDVAAAFHRSLYVFCCISAACVAAGGYVWTIISCRLCVVSLTGVGDVLRSA